MLGLSIRLEILGLALISFVFLLLVLMDSQYVFLPSEGIFNDQYLAAQLLEQFRGPEDSFWRALTEARLPAGRDPVWHGRLFTYLYMPFHAIFGAHWNLARYWCLLFTLGSLAFTYGFMRRVYGPAAAMTAIFLLVVHPGYMMMIRIGSAFFSPMHFFSCGCLYFSSLWWDTRRHVFFGIAIAFIGLGLSTMLWFGWFALGMAVATAFLARKIFVRMRLTDWKSALRLVLAGTVGLLAGSVLLLYREWSGESDLLNRVSSDVGSGLGSYISTIPSSWSTISEIWWSFSSNVSFAINPAANMLYPWAVVVAIAVAAGLSYRHSSEQPLVLLPVVLAVMIAQVPLALRPTWDATFFFYPLPQMVLAAAIIGSARALRGRKAFAPFLVCILVLFAAEIRSMSACVTLLRDRIEQGAHLTPVYHLAEWLQKNQSPERPVFLNKGDQLEPYLYFLEPERGQNLVSVAPDELLGRLEGGGESGQTDWLFVYGLPRVSPEGLWPVSQRKNFQIDVVAEFRQREDSKFFGPPATVYRIRRGEIPESADKTDGL